MSYSNEMTSSCAAVGNIDTSGISMLDEVKKIIDRRGLKVNFVSAIFLVCDEIRLKLMIRNISC